MLSFHNLFKFQQKRTREKNPITWDKIHLDPMIFPRARVTLWILENSIWEKVIQRNCLLKNFGKDFKICIVSVGKTLRGELYPLYQQIGQCDKITFKLKPNHGFINLINIRHLKPSVKLK